MQRRSLGHEPRHVQIRSYVLQTCQARTCRRSYTAVELIEISAHVDMLCACVTRTACSPSPETSISDKPKQDD